jgi:hypothetical protein
VTSIGPSFGATGADDASLGTKSWSNPGNAVSDNGAYATSASSNSDGDTHYLKVTNFSTAFAAIPDAAEVTHIQVDLQGRITASSGAGFSAADLNLRLVLAGVIQGTDLGGASSWSSFDAVHTVQADVALTGAQVKNTGFGVAYQAHLNHGTSFSSVTLGIDYVALTLTYTASTPVDLGSLSTAGAASLTARVAVPRHLASSVVAAASVAATVDSPGVAHLAPTLASSATLTVALHAPERLASAVAASATLTSAVSTPQPLGAPTVAGAASVAVDLLAPHRHVLAIPATGTSSGYLTTTNSDYNTARNSGSPAGTNNGAVVFGQNKNALAVYQLWQGFLTFDLSSVPDGVDLLEVHLKVGSDAVDDDHSTQDFTVQARIYNYGTLNLSDWVPGTSMSALPLAASYATSNGWTFNQYMTFSNVGTVLFDAVAAGGTLQLLLTSDRVVAGTTPTTEEYLGSAVLTSATLKPTLEVVYRTASEPVTFAPTVSGSGSLTASLQSVPQLVASVLGSGSATLAGLSTATLLGTLALDAAAVVTSALTTPEFLAGTVSAVGGLSVSLSAPALAFLTPEIGALSTSLATLSTPLGLAATLQGVSALDAVLQTVPFLHPSVVASGQLTSALRSAPQLSALVAGDSQTTVVLAAALFFDAGVASLSRVAFELVRPAPLSGHVGAFSILGLDLSSGFVFTNVAVLLRAEVLDAASVGLEARAATLLAEVLPRMLELELVGADASGAVAASTTLDLLVRPRGG